MSHYRAGRLAEAKRLYVGIPSWEPKNVVALNLLGVIERHEGNARRATELIGKVIDTKSDYANAHNNLGLALLMLDNYCAGFQENEW